MAELEALLVGIIRQFSAHPLPSKEHRQESEQKQRRMAELLSRLEQGSFAALLQSMADHPAIPPHQRSQVVEACLEGYGRKHPGNALRAIEAMAKEGFAEFSSADRERMIPSLFRNWSLREPSQALAWFEEKRQAGDAIVHVAAVMESGIAARAVVDPGAALDLIEREVLLDPAVPSHAGGAIAQRLRTPQEHHAFLRALGRKTEQQPESAILAQVRDTYLSQLHGDLVKWPFEDAVALVAGEMTPAEQQAFAASIAERFALLSDRPPWADWLLRQRNSEAHSRALERAIDGWTLKDPTAAGEWLRTLPQGPLREDLSKRYESMLPYVE